MAIVWSEIHENFKNLLEDSTTGVNSLTSITNSFTESTDTVELASTPSSIYNGKYSIVCAGMNELASDFITYLTYNYLVELRIAFELNTRGDKDDYNDALKDVEEIIRQRLDPTTYSSSMTIILFDNMSRIEFPDNPDLERFAIVTLQFSVKGRVSLN